MIAGIIIPVIAMAGLGLLFGLGLAYALKIFGVEVDPTLALIITKLPGSNCGACGKAGCAGFAQALKEGGADPSMCVVGKDQDKKDIAKILGIEYDAKERRLAAVMCGGGKNAKDKYSYHGIRSCKAAVLVFGGFKECISGCLGLGDCVNACPFDAITISGDGLASVDIKKCTGCKKCIKACPKNIIKVLPERSLYYVSCSLRDPGPATIKVCKAGCIACGKCVKECPVSAIVLKDNLAVIDYTKCTDCGKCIGICPTHAIKKRG